MAIVVNSNITAIKTQNSLNSANEDVSKSIQRMSTGLRINSAADDAAGLYVGKGLEKQISGSKVAQQNVQIGVNVLQTAEGDLTTIQDNLLRIRDLSVQAANGTYSTDSLNAIKNEVKQRMYEVNRLAAASNFNGMYLLNGTVPSAGLRLQVGADADAATNAIYVQNVFTSASCGALGLITGTGTTGIDEAVTTGFASSESAAAFIANVDTALDNVTTRRSEIGVTQNRITSASDALAITIENLTASKSTIMDADIASESTNYMQAQILQQASASLLTQANALPQIALTLIG